MTLSKIGRLGAAPAVAAGLAIVVAVAPLSAAARERPSPTRLDRALYEAAEQGRLDDISSLLDQGANANAILLGDGSPLIGAARKGELSAVRLLLERGADGNLPVPGDGNPLIMAARGGHLEVVELLLDRGARVDEVVAEDENALIQASGAGRLEVVTLLVARGADVNARVPTARGEIRTPVGMARAGGHAAVVAYLLAAGARDQGRPAAAP